jgi:hypothetical protein
VRSTDGFTHHPVPVLFGARRGHKDIASAVILRASALLIRDVEKPTMIAGRPFAINTKKGCRARYPSRQLLVHNNRLYASTTGDECRNDRISRCSMAHQQWNRSVREKMPRHAAEKALS